MKKMKILKTMFDKNFKNYLKKMKIKIASIGRIIYKSGTIMLDHYEQNYIGKCT